ncbi:MaoC/PaaZ C-terminal domain-containing protein [Dactylosporangium sucinum]|uniref:3-alpha,7-alpha, 12-alpha-trihydroxy-5-beta-cholest-24-enoyl-CoA hydratase n=1 Tax=Dactylosporangium sucinum TaxID=1424081 RepID=A0A917UCR9_9ACTN|nr:MaoC/PaaZ C-terminal domain-containing protein [Dactylosporangium sucinum]GGM75110.1 3-alpha,7-alpha,12-alpha-trihydroxy-5-beta-cholest-24-enoyl-CoA hydratase [Dactylosporangium sucinum]
MPIDPGVALAAPPTVEEIGWDASDVLLYHLALGAGADPVDPAELRYATESGSVVVPTFAVVAPMLRATQPPRVAYPGVEVDLRKILHGSQRVELHNPIPRDGKAAVRTRVADLYDKGSAAVVVVDTEATGIDGVPLWTSSMRMFARGEGGFGGHRGPAGPPDPPQRAPDHTIVTPTLPQQALWYRLLGDRNPLHADPAVAETAGFPRPILHGLCTYGIACRAIVDAVLDGRVERVRAIEARFAGVVYPGETLRTSVWREDGRLLFASTVDERDNAPALAGGELTVDEGQPA